MLILGGTGEARALAGLLTAEKRVKVVTSLAGRTTAPERPVGEWRSGGFGGSDGLAAYLEREAIDVVADATHPFAAAMSRNAFEACRRTGTRYVRLERPAWRPEPGDRWQAVESVEQAAAALAPRARAFLTVGGGEIAAFFARADTALLARMIEPPEEAPPHLEILLARPPFTLEGELALLKERGIDVVVCKNSGGEATRAKLDAARELGLLVIMVARPEKPDAPCAATPEGLRDLVLKLI
ncbi:MAG TPA: cobalt-precorrin-6A reductase [Hyphomicrobiales bacterium]|nr:cobalt-precorrin-6A reductase [Hyphomicrobiales bacterium]